MGPLSPNHLCMVILMFLFSHLRNRHYTLKIIYSQMMTNLSQQIEPNLLSKIKP